MRVGARRRVCLSYIHSGDEQSSQPPFRLSREITTKWKDILARRGGHHLDCESCDGEGPVLRNHAALLSLRLIYYRVMWVEFLLHGRDAEEE